MGGWKGQGRGHLAGRGGAEPSGERLIRPELIFISARKTFTSQNAFQVNAD